MNKRAFTLAILAFASILIFYEKSCEAAENHLCRVQSAPHSSWAKIVASVKVQPSSLAGSSSPVRWKVDVGPVRGEYYLVIALDEAVRFDGGGFIAMPPQARAPQSISFERDRVRLFVALTGPLANIDGEANVFFYQSGPQKIDWAVIGVSGPSDGCTESIVQSGTLNIQIGMGAPELLADNKFEAMKGGQNFGSPDGKHALYVTEHRFQVRDNVTGDLIFTRAGTKPAFSKTGRYITFFNSSGLLEIVDTVAIVSVYTASDEEQGDFGGINVILWSDFDTVMIGAYSRKGAISVFVPLINNRHIFSGWLNCNACQAYGGSSFLLDIDRIAFSIRGPQANNGNLYSRSLLEVADTPDNIAYWTNQKPEERQGRAPTVPRFVINPFNSMPQWDTFEKIAIPENTEANQEPFLWATSDNFFVSMADLWADGFNDKIKNPLLLTKTHVMQPLQAPIGPSVLKIGKPSPRSIEVAGKLVSPPTFMQALHSELHNFSIDFGPYDNGILLPVIGSKDDYEIRINNAYNLLKKHIVDNKFSNGRLEMLQKADEKRLNDGQVVKTFSSLPACNPDFSFSDENTPLIISASRLIRLWEFHLADADLFVAEQNDGCGTAPDTYGDISIIRIPDDTKLKPQFARVAFSNAEGGVTELPGTVGDRLRLSDGPDLMISVTQGNLLLVVSKATGTALIYDYLSGKNLAEIRNMPNPLNIIAAVNTPDNKYFIQVNSDGSLYFYNIERNALELLGRYIDGELVLFDKQLRYEATPEGADYISVHVAGANDLYTLDQFESRLKTPGIAKAHLTGQALPTTPPLLGISPPSLRAKSDHGRIAVEAWSTSPLTSLYIKVDGVSRESLPLSGNYAKLDFPLSKYLGSRWVNFSARNVDGLLSTYRTIEVGNDKYSGSLRSVSIGVDNYKGGHYGGIVVHDLGFAASDATRFDKAVKTDLAPRYSGFTSTVVNSGDMTSDKILEAVRSAASATQQQDTLLLFVASHGINDPAGFSMIAQPKRAGGDVTTLPFDNLADALREAKGRIVIFIDACHAAGATHDNALTALSKINDNVVIIAASKGTQVSSEGPAWGGGAFTSAIVSNLDSLGQSEEFMSIDVLYQHIRMTVASATREKQTPWLSRTSWQGDQSLN